MNKGYRKCRVQFHLFCLLETTGNTSLALPRVQLFHPIGQKRGKLLIRNEPGICIHAGVKALKEVVELREIREDSIGRSPRRSHQLLDDGLKQ